MTRDDLRPAAIALAEGCYKIWSRGNADRFADTYPTTEWDGLSPGVQAEWEVDAAAILDALSPSAKSTLARYLLGDAIAGLDVERLARALALGLDRHWLTLDIGPDDLPYIAEDIAAEYARLAEPTP